MMSGWIIAPAVLVLYLLASVRFPHVEGEYVTAEGPAMSAAVAEQECVAIQLRYLQPPVEIEAEHNPTIALLLPIGLNTSMRQALSGRK
ncbi:MAG TPA: hypothetical protein PLZ95_11855 [Bryobacteraceae bacterium]|nr:hypothetical protein [Bryobacteraceae bacterium]